MRTKHISPNRGRSSRAKAVASAWPPLFLSRRTGREEYGPSLPCSRANRYTWLRDSALTLYSLLTLGFTEEARAFMGWLNARCHELEENGALQPMYGIDGEHDLTETLLDHLEGYRKSQPVRIGNAAYKQK